MRGTRYVCRRYGLIGRNMSKLHLEGYITTDYNEIVALSKIKPSKSQKIYKARSIVEGIEDFAKDHGTLEEHERGLGGREAWINNCNIRVYFTDKECSLENAMLAFDTFIYGGDINTEVEFEGYSEYTITGLELKQFSIGGHDLQKEFLSYYGKYMHLILEC